MFPDACPSVLCVPDMTSAIVLGGFVSGSVTSTIRCNLTVSWQSKLVQAPRMMPECGPRLNIRLAS